MLEKVLIFVPMAAAFLVCIGSAALICLLKYRSVKTDARVTGIEQKQKYYDSSKDRRTAYDYRYAYTGPDGKCLTGILYRNVPEIEYNVNDTFPVLYLRDFPKLVVPVGSLGVLRMIPYMTFLMSAMFLLFWIFI